MRVCEPLLFHPILKSKIWGGRKMEVLLNKRLPEGQKIGESWEISDRPGDESVVACGRHAGRTLGEIVRSSPLDLLGPSGMMSLGGVPAGRGGGGRFPLLIKFIDASDVLSVQVHPDDETAARAGDSGKSEAWFIVQADPGARIVRGLAPGTTRMKFENALKSGRLDGLLRSFPVTAGDCIACPPGMLHAIGKGVLLAEIQQNSDLTYRVYDWGRLGDDGKPRALHTEEALRCMRFGDPGEEFYGDMSRDVVEPGTWRQEEYGRSRSLLSGRYFALELAEISRSGRLRLNGGYRVAMALAGKVELAPGEGDAFSPIAVAAGTCVLIPAAVRSVVLRPSGDCGGRLLTAFPPKERER
jgi:mannose-6-phosphate isomerase